METLVHETNNQGTVNEVVANEKKVLLEIKKAISSDVKSGETHLRLLQKVIIQFVAGKVTAHLLNDTVGSYKESFKLHNISTHNKYSSYYARLVKMTSSDFETLKETVSTLDILTLKEVDTIALLPTVSNRGKSNKKEETKEVTISTSKVEEEEHNDIKEDRESPKAHHKATKADTNRLLESLSTLMTLEADTLLIKVAKLDKEDVALFNELLNKLM